MIRRVIVALGLVFAAAVAGAAGKTLDEVVSEVYTAEGMTAAQIADRGMQCLQSASSNVADKVTPLRDGDTAYAIVATGFTKMMVKFTARSRMAVHSKDGRFKISHTNIEQPDELRGGWMPIFTYPGAGSKQAAEAMSHRSAAVARCITAKPETPGGNAW